MLCIDNVTDLTYKPIICIYDNKIILLYKVAA